MSRTGPAAACLGTSVARYAVSGFVRVLIVLISSVLIAAAPIQPSGEQPRPVGPGSVPKSFVAGERLTYAISWQGIRGGTAVMEVADSPPVQGRPTLRLLTTAKSNAFVSTFFPVDNRVESIVDAVRLLPRRMVFHRREGRRKNDYDITFRHEEEHVIAVKDGVSYALPIPQMTQDALSCLYYLRSLPVLQPGSSFYMNVHHDKKNYRLEVRVEGLEMLQGSWGKVETVRVLAIMPFQGIFLNEGNIRVWLTNDTSHTPLMMKAKVLIGSIVARLIENQRPVPPSFR